MDKIIEKELSYKLSGIFFKIQNELGRFCRERQYADALEDKLKKENINFKREFPIEIGERKSNFVDFLIENRILVDLKAKPFIEKEDYYQMKRYLEATNLELGLVINFRSKYLKPKRILNPKYSGHSDKFVVWDRIKAFTLIETLVIVIITIILSSIMITYSHIGEKQIVLFRDQAKVVEVLNRAKFLALQKFSQTEADKPCAYGVHFDNNTGNFLIFKDLDSDPLTSGCQGNNKYDASNNELFEKYELDERLKFQITPSSGGIFEIVFIPPDPTIKMTPNATDATIKIVDKVNSSNNKVIKVNNFGQITAQ